MPDHYLKVLFRGITVGLALVRFHQRIAGPAGRDAEISGLWRHRRLHSNHQQPAAMPSPSSRTGDSPAHYHGGGSGFSSPFSQQVGEYRQLLHNGTLTGREFIEIKQHLLYTQHLEQKQELTCRGGVGLAQSTGGRSTAFTVHGANERISLVTAGWDIDSREFTKLKQKELNSYPGMQLDWRSINRR